MGDKVNLIYKLSGSEIDEGIDVFQLSPMLLSFGKLITEAHKTIHPDSQDVAVNIKPFKKGSFEIDIVMFGKSIVGQLIDFVNSTKGQEIKETLEFIGLLSGIPVSALWAIKKLKGRVKSAEKLESGDVRYTSEDNITITVKQEVHKLLQNQDVRDALHQSIARPLENKDVDSVESYLKEDEVKTKVQYDKEIIEPIRTYLGSPIVESDDVSLIENKRLLWVHPKRGSYEGEKHSWSFRIIGADHIITANILDGEFLEGIKDGSIRLAQPDKLLVEIIEKQHLKNDIPYKITHDIVKVKEYNIGKHSKQISLDFQGNNNE